MAEEKILDKIRGLLAKAESTEFTEEAELFLDKATELMAKHRISEALLAQNQPDDNSVDRIFIDLGKWHVPKSSLIVGLCKTFESHCIWSQKSSTNKRIAIVGHKSDIQMIETLFVSLEIQLDRELLNVNGYDKGHTRSLRSSFAYGYCSRVAERVSSLYSKSFDDEMNNISDSDSNSVALVLASRDENARAKFEEWYHTKPRYRSASSRVSNYSSYNDGHSAANKADIGQGGLHSGRKSITS